MPTLLVKNTGSSTAPYDTWATALSTLSAAATAMAAGDTLWVSSAHTETAASLNITVPGTVTNPSRILCVTESGGGGASATATGALIDITGATFQVAGNFYCEGITWRSSTTSAATVNFAFTGGNVQRFRNCRFEQTGGNTNSTLKFGAVAAGVSTSCVMRNCTFRLSFAGQRIALDYNVRIVGGGLDAAGTPVSAVFNLGTGTRGASARVEGFDIGAGGTAACALVGTIGGGGCFLRMRSLRLPSSWTGVPVTAGQLKAGDRVELIDASSGSTFYKLWFADYAGLIRDESTVKVTAQTRSYRMASGAECTLAAPIVSHEVEFPLTTSAQTITWDVCTDNVTLNNGDCWIEIDYYATNGSLLSSVVTNAVANLIAATANHTTSSTTWTTTGLTTPVRQSLSATVTAGSASQAIARILLVKPSTTMFAAEELVVA